MPRSNCQTDRWRALADLPDAALVANEAGRIIYANAAAEQLYGCCSGGLAGVAVLDLLEEGDSQAIAPAEWAERLAGRRFHRTRDGRRFCADVRVAMAGTDPGADPGPGLVATVRDVTAAAEAERAIRNSELRYRTIYELTNDAVMLLDTQHFFDCNPAALRLFRCPSREEFFRLHPVDLSPPIQPDGTETRRAAQRQMEVVMERGAARFEWLHRRMDGEEFIGDVLLTRIELDGRAVFQAVVRDISARKRAEQHLLLQQHLAARLSAAATLDAALESCVHAAISATGQPVAAIYLAEGENAFRAAATHGLSESFLRIAGKFEVPASGGDPPSRRFPLNQRLAEMSPEYRRACADEGILAAAMVPVLHEDRILALFGVGSRTLDGLPQWTVEVLEAIAALAGQALGRLTAEEAARIGQRNLHALIDTMQEFLLVLDLQGRILEANPALLERLDYTKEEVRQMHLRDLHPPENARFVHALLDELADAPRTRSPLPFLAKGGARTAVETTFSRGRWNGEEAIFGIARDISDRIRAEEALVNAHSELRQIFNATVPLCVLDNQRRMVRVNDRYCELFGIDGRAALGQRNCQVVGCAECSLGDCRLDRIIRGEQSVELEWELLRPGDGGTVHCLVSSTPYRTAAGIAAGVVLSFTDITARKCAEQEARAYAAALEAANRLLENSYRTAEAATRAKSEFLANMSHEIRTPMTAILGYTDLLMDPKVPEQQRAAHLQTIRRNGLVLLDLINDILDLSKIEAGALAVRRERCNPWQIVEEVLSLMDVRAREKQLPLAAEYEFPLPETICSDAVRLRQILVNLVGNALKFTERGRVTLRVRYLKDAAGDSGRLQFEVADTGIGMTAEQIACLFQPFMQVDASSTRRFGGTGLGLTISRRLARLLGGDIEVASRPGKGSVFTVTVSAGPLADTPLLHQPPYQPQPQRPRQPAAAPRLAGRVLLAEDGVDNQRLLRFLLKQAGLEVDLAENGVLAHRYAMQSLAEGRPYRLILMDIQMPEMDGYQAAERLRGEGWTGPIIALTAHAMSGDREKCLACGFDDYVSKPVDRGKLYAAVTRFLERQPAGKAATARSTAAESAAADAGPGG